MVVIVYETQGGTSKRYAEWLAERLGAEFISVNDADGIDDDVIFIGWRAGPMISGLNSFSKKEKVIAAICVGLEIKDEKAMDVIRNKNGITNLFYVRGGMDRSVLSFSQKLLMFIINIKMILFNHTPEDKEIRRVMMKGGDFSSPEQLDEFTEWFSRR